jgi:hypothetical protein
VGFLGRQQNFFQTKQIQYHCNIGFIFASAISFDPYLDHHLKYIACYWTALIRTRISIIFKIRSSLYLVITRFGVLILQLTLGLKLFKFVSVSLQYDVGFRDACRILGADNVFWDSLLMFVLSESKLTCTIIIWVMSNIYLFAWCGWKLATIVVTSIVRICCWFSYVVSWMKFYCNESGCL